jgi:hypothetical protein
MFNGVLEEKKERKKKERKNILMEEISKIVSEFMLYSLHIIISVLTLSA